MSVTLSAAVSATTTALYGSKPASILSETGAPVIYSRERPSKEREGFLEELTARANAAAKSLAFGSVLIGPGSESDEFGDVAFWLGEGDYRDGHEPKVIEALGLQDRLPTNLRFVPVSVSPSTHLPALLSLPSLTDEVKGIVDLLSQLEDVHCFLVQDMAGDEGMVACFLLGRYREDGLTPGWAGLLGVGVWTW